MNRYIIGEIMDNERRKFIKGIIGSAAAVSIPFFSAHILFGKEVVTYPVTSLKQTDKRIRIIRPPGAVEEVQFNAGCTRCGLCQDACEIGAIQYYTEADGLLYQTPYIDPSKKACNLCFKFSGMKCTHVCPTGVLKETYFEDMEKVRMATIELFPDRCLAHKAKYIRNEQRMLSSLDRSYKESEAIYERRGPCGKCYDFCPVRERAITLEPGSLLAPIIHPEHCLGCGLCEEACRQVLRGIPAISMVSTRGGK